MIFDTITKQPAESFVIGVDYSNVLDREEIIDSGNSSYIIVDTEYPTANDLISYPETLTTSLDGKTLLARISGGLDGRIYKVSFLASTSLSNIYEQDVTVKMVD